MNKLSRSLTNNIFSFLPVKDVQKYSRVSKRHISKNHKAIIHNYFTPRKNQIFYMIGHPILIGIIGVNNGRVCMMSRKSFQLSEIRDAFPINGQHRLFKNEIDALMYSRCLRTDPIGANDSDDIKQSAVYKVQFIRPILENQPVIQKETLEYISRPRPLELHRCFEVAVEYCNAEIDFIHPIEGFLKIDYKDENKFKNCGSYTYPQLPEEKQKSQRCILM